MGWKKIENKQSESWIFESNGDLEGEYIVSREAKSKKGKPLTFHEFRLVSGEIVSVLGGAVLDRIFSEKVEKGQKVRIKYLGDQEGKSGTYKNYSVEVWVEE